MRRSASLVAAAAIQKIHTSSKQAGNAPVLEPIQSLRGLLAKYGPATLADEIAQNRAEMIAGFPAVRDVNQTDAILSNWLS